ncbi:MAG: MotA/TolQ/ExbB proton channel family protein [Fuerstiella sp.]|nr:MotA/TolQ/ExbB proton channel family protein [Fuerstiella sp.]
MQFQVPPVDQLALLAQIDISPILRTLGYAIYTALAVSFIYGVYCIIVLMRRVAQKSFPGRESAEQFLDDVGGQIEANHFDNVLEICDSPELWARAAPQLVIVAIENRNKPARKIRQLLSEFYEREIVSEFDRRLAWLNTIVKSAPMLGLLGTVVGMIGAFREIAGSAKPEPSDLADDISFALLTTACGLAIAIPVVVMTNFANVRIARLQDSVDEVMGVVVDDLEASQVRAGLSSEPKSGS